MNSQFVTHKNSSYAWKIFLPSGLEMSLPSAKRHLHSKKIEDKALLPLDHCPAHPSADVLKLKDGKIKAMFLPKNSTALIQPMDQGIIQAYKAYYHR
jgi:hypothetical protein